VGLPGLPSALAGPPGPSNAPSGLQVPSNGLSVFLGPADILYPSHQAASLGIWNFDWDQWTSMSANRIGFGPPASHRAWVTDTLIPTLAYYHYILWSETMTIRTYQANHPNISRTIPCLCH